MQKLEIWDWIKIINGTNELPASWEEVEKQYNQYMLSVIFSNIPELMVLVNKINNKGFTPLMHFMALKHGYKSKFGNKKVLIDFIPKKKVNKDLELIMNYFNVSEKIALGYLDVISDEEMLKIRNEDEELNGKTKIKKSKLTQKELKEMM